MQSQMISLVSLIAFISCASCSVPLYNYGPGAGDRRLPSGANPAVIINLREKYVFYGVEYSRICISDNGYITFGTPVQTNRPVSFPITVGSYAARRAEMVAPYWSDVDTRCGGDVYYRQVQLELNSQLSLKIQRDINLSSSGKGFLPTSAIVVTWEGVTPQNKLPCKDKRRNTFQLVLTTDGQKTFTMFRYKFLEWHTSSAGRGPASAGANAGDLSNGFKVSNNPDVFTNLTLVSMSNVGVGGLFVYELDLGPNSRVQSMLMEEMLALAAAESMDFGVAEAELYTLHEDVSASKFNRQEQAHHEEYIGGLTDATKNVEFYPFGSAEDSSLGDNDEATSGKDYLKIPIYFFGKNYSNIIVYTNGFLTLEDCFDFQAYAPRELKTANVPIIAPFFADADTRGVKSGKIYYRQTDDASLLSRAKEDIEFSFSDVSFTPEQLYIATWDKVGFYNRHDDRLNSFQVVIATDSHTSYVLFIYKHIQWTSPDSANVPIGVGLGADPASLPVMGISDGKTFERLVTASEEPWDETKILNIDMDIGNTGVAGMWIFEASRFNKQTSANHQSSETVDPKMQYTKYQQVSHPYDASMKSDIESLASELKNTNKYLG